MSLSGIRTRVSNIVNRDDVPDTAGGAIDRFINDAQRRVCRGHNFTFMESEATTDTVDEQQDYSLPTATGDLRFKTEISLELIDTNSYRVPLKRVFKQDAEKKRAYRDSTEIGTPKHYSIQRGQIYLYPAPDHTNNSDAAWTLNLEYYGFLDDLTADSDTNDLISNYPEVVEAVAVSMAFRYVYEEEKAEYWEGKASGMIAEMIKEDFSNKYGNIEEGMEPEEGAGCVPRQYGIDDY